MNHMEFAHKQHEWLGEISEIANSQKSTAEKIEAVKLLAFEINETLKDAGENIIIDDLTGFVSQPFVGEFLEKRYVEAEHFGEDISVLVVSLKDFEAYEEGNGPLETAAAIKEAARAIESAIRDDDIGCRYGDGRFAVVLPEANPIQASRLGQIIKEKIEGLSLGEGHALEVEFAAASKSEGADSSANLMEKALGKACS